MMYSDQDILYDNLLDRLGGREMLELMIEARDFGYIYYNNQGLRFTFRSPGEERLRQAEFIPMAVSNTTQAYYAPATYQIRLVVQALGGLSWELVKPYHNVILEHPDRMAKVFETVAKVAVTFP